MTTAIKKRLTRLETAFAEATSQLAISDHVKLLARAFTIEELEAFVAQLADKPEGTTLGEVLAPQEYAAVQAKLAAAE